MKTVNQIKQYIEGIPAGQLFSSAEFQHLGSPENVRKILSRLVQSDEIKRVSRGIFVKPKRVEYVGESLPSPYEIIQSIAKNSGETISIHGAEAARRLHLTTQVPLQLVFYTSGYSRTINIGNQSVRMQHVSPRKLLAPGTVRGSVISALWYLGQGNVRQKTIHTIKKQLSEEDFNGLLQESSQMPAWMAKQFYLYQQKK